MTHEIVWTAAARTHVAKERGSSSATGTGYGNVQLTRGIPPNLTNMLENLQAYRELGPTADGSLSSEIVPIELFHFIGKYAGQPLQILGRRARTRAASGRSNIIVHMVTHFSSDFVDTPASVSVGPAAEIRSIPWKIEWPYEAEPVFRDDVAELQPRETAPRQSRPCHTWQQVAGDAGWAGVLAESAARGQTVALIVPRTRDWSTTAIELFDEALHLLAPALRWQIGFSTYWTGAMPTGMLCHWRVIYEGTEEASRHRRQPQVICLDLTKKKQCANEGPLVDIARLGGRPQWEKSPRDPLSPPGNQLTQSRSGIETDDLDRNHESSEKDYRLAPAPKKRTVRSSLPPSRRKRDAESPTARRIVITLGSLAAIGMIAILIVTMLPKRPSLDKTPSIAVDQNRPGDPNPIPLRSKETADPPQLQNKQPDIVAGPSTKFVPPSPVPIPPPVKSVPPANPPDPKVEIPPVPPEAPSPFQDLIESNCRLPIRKPRGTSFAQAEFESLASLRIDNPGDLVLTILGSDDWCPRKTFELIPESTGTEHQWKLVRKIQGAFGNGDLLAQFRLQQKDSFWNLEMKSHSALQNEYDLPFCWLGFDYGGKRIPCALRAIDNDKFFFKWEGLREKLRFEQDFPLSMLAEKGRSSSEQLLLVRVEYSGEAQLKGHPLTLKHQEQGRLEFNIDNVAVPLTAELSLAKGHVKLKWRRLLKLMRLQGKEITGPVDVIKDEDANYEKSNQLHIACKNDIERWKKDIENLENPKKDKEQDENTDKARIKMLQEFIANRQIEMNLLTQNMSLIKKQDEAYRQLWKGQIRIVVVWDVAAIEKEWPVPKSVTQLDAIVSPEWK